MYRYESRVPTDQNKEVRIDDIKSISNEGEGIIC